ncbi:MAG: hypothetical protein KDI56_10685 [Xanthomonadales bacterium]|nr:hypothetical protein [Xanthomonadales bacterium]
MELRILFSGEIGVSFSHFSIETDAPVERHSIGEFSGQKNGLLGAAREGRLLFTARPKDATIDLEIQYFRSRPEVDKRYDKIVEASFERPDEPVFLCQWAHEVVYPLDLPPGEYRVRYCVKGLGLEYGEDDIIAQSTIPGQGYLVQFWPEEPSEDRIVRQSSAEAKYWHSRRK